MYKHTFSSYRSSLRPARQRGATLVIVLVCLVLLATLTMAFLTSVTTELRSAKTYADGGSAKRLSQATVNLALAQISEASRGTDPKGKTLAWASQPGMIRTYDDSGAVVGYYRLYSWSDMTGLGAFDPATTANAVPSNWSTQKALFTDLNQPIRCPDKGVDRLFYPIVDANNLTTLAVVNNNKTYPGISPDAAVDGFHITSGAPLAAGSTPNPVPMPVKWLYVLEDGSIVLPAAGANDAQASVPGAKAGNEIIGRIAFWTDDECCKINVNVASEGSYADVPRSNPAASAEGALQTSQPVKGEYQRYPGHPSTVSLSAVLKKPDMTMTDADWAKTLFGIVPRINGGGSVSGTIPTGTSSLAITPDTDRLYASIDELIFKPKRLGKNRELNASEVLDKESLERNKFFLTTCSRAPDLNLFNKPRVCIWPISSSDDNLHRTAFDRLIAFCSTLNGYPFYFQRQSAVSPLIDLPSAQDASSGLKRNRAVLEYLRTLCGQNIPGFGGNLRAKYGTDTDQILTEIFDFIRSTNLADSGLLNENRYTVSINKYSNGMGQVTPIEDTATNTRGFGRFRTVQGVSLLFIANADGDEPIQVDQNGVALSAGAKVAAGSVRVQAIFLPQLFDPAVGSVFNNPNFRWKVTGLDKFEWSGAGGSFKKLGFSAAASAERSQSSFSVDNAFYGDQFGFRQLVNADFVSASIDVPKSGPLSFRGGDLKIELMSPDGTVVQTVTLNFPGGTFPLPRVGPAVVQNLNWDGTKFTGGPSQTNMRYFTGAQGRLASTGGGGNAWFLDSAGGDGNPGRDVVRSVSANPGDIRLIAARKNPPLPGEPGYPFAQVNAAKWNDLNAGVMGMHTLFSGCGEPYYGAALGRLVSNLNYELNIRSGGFSLNSVSTHRFGSYYISAGVDCPLNGVAVGSSASIKNGEVPGDWDNAPLTLRDGPFINKPDEGATKYNWNSRAGNQSLVNSPTLFTPNRLVPSAVIFGSLPTGVLANRPWQTLLFRPDPAGKHPGSKNRSGLGASVTGLPADHLWLDLFHMPVVEPYAISEPLSTAGRINMNYQIVPFTYIRRDTAIRALLKSEKVIVLKDADVDKYKTGYAPAPADTRRVVDITETLKGFDQRFNSKDIFRAASEVCLLPLVPVGSTYAEMSAPNSTFWNDKRLTGDNSRERPYATIYPRLTTKSNTYTIHYRVQTLQKAPGAHLVGLWDETRDKVMAEFRGLQTIERFIDPNDPGRQEDYADSGVTTPIGDLYKFRVIQAKQFAP